MGLLFLDQGVLNQARVTDTVKEERWMGCRQVVWGEIAINGGPIMIDDCTRITTGTWYR